MKMTPALTVLMVGMTISIVGAIMLLFEKTSVQSQPIVSQAQFNDDSASLFSPRKSREDLRKERKRQ